MRSKTPEGTAVSRGTIWGFALFGTEAGRTGLFRNPDNLFWPDVWTDRQCSFALDGYFCEAERLTTGRSAEEREALSSAFLQDHPGWLRRIQNGCFNLVVHDQREQRTLICSDQYGLLALYVLRLPQGIWFAGDLATLREIAPVALEIDETGLAELYWFGYQMGERTAYLNVEMVPAGSVCSFSWKEGRERRENWAESIRKPGAAAPPPAREIPFRLREIVERACDRVHTPIANYGIKLSAGLDSRLIAGCWRHRPLNAYTWGDRRSLEVRLAGRLAERLEFEHRVIPVEGSFFPGYYLAMFEQYGIMEFLHELAAPLMRTDGVRLVLDGLLGDVFIGGGYFDDARKKSFADLFRSAFGIRRTERALLYGNDEMAHLLAGMVRVADTDFPVLEQQAAQRLSRQTEDILQDISSLLARIRSEDDSFEFLVAKFLLNCRTRRYTALQGNTSRPQIQTLYPFIDTDLVRFLHSIPLRQFQYRDLYLRLYSETLPRIRDIPALRSNLPFRFPRRTHALARVVRGSLQRIGKRLFTVSGGHLNLFVMDGVQWERWLAQNEAFRDGIGDLLRSSALVDQDLLRSTLSQVARHRHSVVGTRLLLTASFCRWHQRNS